MSTVWGTLVSGDSPTGLGTDTITNSGLSAVVRTDTSKQGTAWQYEVEILAGLDVNATVGTRDEVGYLTRYFQNGELRDESGGLVATGPPLTAGDILTISYANDGSNLVQYKHNGTVVGSADDGGYGDPVYGYVSIYGSDSVRGHWATLTYPVAGISTWDSSVSVVQITLDLPATTLVNYSVDLDADQRVLATIDFPAPLTQLFEAILPAPSRQGFSLDAPIPSALGFSLDLGASTALPVELPPLDFPAPSTAYTMAAFSLDLAATLRTTLALDLPASQAELVAYSLDAVTGFTVPVAFSLDIDAGTGRPELVEFDLRLPAGITAGATRLVVPASRIWLDGHDIPILAAEVWADDASPTWQAQISLADPRHYGLFLEGRTFTLELAGRQYAMIVDQRSLSQAVGDDGEPGNEATLVGLSPVALRGERWTSSITQTWGEPTLVSAVLAELLDAPVEMRIRDWVIPAGRLAAEGAAPLAIATQIAEAAGAVLGSHPDGSLYIRYRYPVAAPRVASASPVARLAITDNYASGEATAVTTRINRVRVVDVEPDYQDRLTAELVEDNPLRAWIRAWPSPWRESISLDCTRLPERVFLAEKGISTESHTEVIEIREGEGSVQHPVAAVLAVEYLDANLGAVTVGEGDTRLITAAGGESLLRITYTTRFHLWQAISREPEIQAQFVLEDSL